jgi:hypothetical protein
VENECNGEVVTIQGTGTLMSRYTVASEGSVHEGYFVREQGTGIGSKLNEYRYSEEALQPSTQIPPRGATELPMW